MYRVNERSTAVITLGFRNAEGQLQEPVAVTYRIDDVETGKEIRAWTAVTPGATVAITLTPQDNRILGKSMSTQRVLTYVATYGVNPEDRLSGDATWAVRNLRFLN